MASTVSLSQNPGNYNLAYGPNAVTLSSLTTGATKFVLQVRTVGGTILADIRQTANVQGRAIFDIQNILQSYVHPSPINTEQIGVGNQSPANLQNSLQEVDAYTLRIGDETNGTLDLVTTVFGPYNVIGGKKPFFDIAWSEGPYQGAIQGDDSNPPCTNLYANGQPLSDWNPYVLGSELVSYIPTGNTDYPSGIGANTRVQIWDVNMNDLHTTSYFNALYTGGLPTPNANAQGIEALRISQFEVDGTAITDTIIPNTVENGGGPNVNYGDGTIPSNNTAVITAGVGPQNISSFTYIDGLTTNNFVLDPLCSYYFVQTVAYNPGTCLATHTGYTDESIHYPQMFRIYGRGAAFANTPCLDYDHMQFSWLNSFGFRDYFTFTKKNVRSTRRRANNYLDGTADYNSSNYNTQPGNRGYTTYSQEIQESFTATTNYLTDEQADYLEGLFNSPDVRVRLGQSAPGVGYEQYFFGANITSTSWTERSFRKDKLFQYEIKFKLANNLKSQRG